MMANSTSNKTFCKQITPEEYKSNQTNNSTQSSYTQSQLKLLEQQMLEREKTKKSSSEDDDDDKNDDKNNDIYTTSSEDDDDKNNDIYTTSSDDDDIVKSKSKSKSKAKAKSKLNLSLNLDKFLNKKSTNVTKSKHDTNLDDVVKSVLTMHDVDLKKISTLKNLNKRLENKNHYLQLDLCSSQVEVNELTDKLKVQANLIQLYERKIVKNFRMSILFMVILFMLFYVKIVRFNLF